MMCEPNSGASLSALVKRIALDCPSQLPCSARRVLTMSCHPTTGDTKIPLQVVKATGNGI